MKPVALAAALALVAAGAQAASHSGHGLVARDGWSRPAAAGTTGVGFLTLHNAGAAEVLTGAESPQAARVEIHRSSVAGGIMSMAKVDRLPVPAGGTIRFGPGGLHLMLVGLKMALKPGDRASVTLRFASGAKTATALTVRNPADMGQMDHMAH